MTMKKSPMSLDELINWLEHHGLFIVLKQDNIPMLSWTPNFNVEPLPLYIEEALSRHNLPLVRAGHVQLHDRDALN